MSGASRPSSMRRQRVSTRQHLLGDQRLYSSPHESTSVQPMASWGERSSAVRPLLPPWRAGSVTRHQHAIRVAWC